MQAAVAFAGSFGIPAKRAQPHDQTESRASSLATWRAARASRLTTANQRAALSPARAPQLEAEVNRGAWRAEALEDWTGDVDLANDRRGLRKGLPPGPGRAGGVSCFGDEQVRLRPPRRERANELEDVGAILGVALAPGRPQTRSVELVEREDRGRAACHLDRRRREPFGDRGDPPGIGRMRRRSNGVLQRHIPVGDLGPAAPRRGRRRGMRERDCESRAIEELSKRDPLVRVVDPGGLPSLDAGSRRRCRVGRTRCGSRGRQNDSDEEVCEYARSQSWSPEGADGSAAPGGAGGCLRAGRRGYFARWPRACCGAGSLCSRVGVEPASVAFLATSTARLSRITVTLIWPGYSSWSSISRAISYESSTAWSSSTSFGFTITRISRPAWSA